MNIIIKLLLVLFVSFLLSFLLGLFIIPFLKKKKIKQTLSIYLDETHKSKKNTPTMGGVIFILPPVLIVLVLLLLNKISFSYNLLIIIITFVMYSLIGFLDDYLIIKKNNNKGLSENTKFVLQLITSLIFFYFFMILGNEPLLWIHTINLKLDIGFLYGIFILFVLVASSNAVNLTDGLDGLATGLSIICFITFGLITLKTGWLSGYEEISLFIFSLVGSLFAFLIFNYNPAKIFMGDTGSLSLGATLGALAIITRHEILLIIIGIVFVIETLSCIIQRIYYKFTQKRVFLMTPIHHTLEKKGYNEKYIVKIFWLIGFLASIISLIFVNM